MRIAGTDLDVSPLCCGSGPFNMTLGQETIDRLYECFRAGGGKFFDTAHCYGFWIEGGAGSFERTLGAAVRRHHDEGKVVIATKGGHCDVPPKYPRPDYYLAPEVIATDIADSLERLGVACIDLYLLHRDDSRVPVGEIIDSLNAHVAAGRLRYLGASNWSVQRIIEANQYAAAHGLRGFAVSQVQYSLAQPNAAPAANDRATRYLTTDDAAWHGATKMPVMAFSSTARGYFATGGVSAKQGFDNATSRSRLERAAELARQLGCTTNQVALAYLMGQDFPVIPILGTANLEHLNDAMGSTKLELTPRQVRWLAD